MESVKVAGCFILNSVMYLTILLSTVVIAIFVSQLANLIQNYRIARRLRLPILITPVSWQNPLWVLVGRRFSFLKSLPFNLGAWTQYSLLGWQMHDNYHMHEKLGPAFVIVSPQKNVIIVGDAETASDVLTNWRSYVKANDLYNMFNIFGKNVNTVNGEDWQRHRKITAPAFKEGNCRLVWSSTRTQADNLGHQWSNSTKEVTLKEVQHDTALLAMHVLSAAGFGKEYTSHEALETPEPGHTLSYGASLDCILHHLMMTILFENLTAPTALLPSGMRRLKTAIADFKGYLVERVSEEQKEVTSGGLGKDNLLSTLVRANEAAKNEPPEKSQSGLGRRFVLTDDELYGNLFIFNVAGFETTAMTLTYAIPYLATYPDVQEWVAEEAKIVLGDEEGLLYDNAFPRLVRTLATMVSNPDSEAWCPFAIQIQRLKC